MSRGNLVDEDCAHRALDNEDRSPAPRWMSAARRRDAVTRTRAPRRRGRNAACAGLTPKAVRASGVRHGEPGGGADCRPYAARSRECRQGDETVAAQEDLKKLRGHTSLLQAVRKAPRVIAQIARPRFRKREKARAIAGIKCARRFFIYWLIAKHRGHELIRRFLRLTHQRARIFRVARSIDQFLQRRRSAARLRGEPFPVPRQQRDFARDNAELRPSGRTLLRRTVGQP